MGSQTSGLLGSDGGDVVGVVCLLVLGLVLVRGGRRERWVCSQWTKAWVFGRGRERKCVRVCLYACVK